MKLLSLNANRNQVEFSKDYFKRQKFFSALIVSDKLRHDSVEG